MCKKRATFTIANSRSFGDSVGTNQGRKPWRNGIKDRRLAPVIFLLHLNLVPPLFYFFSGVDSFPPENMGMAANHFLDIDLGNVMDIELSHFLIHSR